MCYRVSVDQWGRSIDLGLTPCGGFRLLLGDHAGGNGVRLVLEFCVADLDEELGLGDLSGLGGVRSTLGVSDLNGLGSGGGSLSLGGGLEGGELLSFCPLPCVFRTEGSLGLGDAFSMGRRGGPLSLGCLNGRSFVGSTLLLLRSGGPLCGFLSSSPLAVMGLYLAPTPSLAAAPRCSRYERA